MKRFILFLPIALLAACHTDDSKPLVKGVSKVPDALFVPVVKEGIEGFYSGLFEPEQAEDDEFVPSNRITLRIDSLVGNRMFGRTIVAGNSRPFAGTFTKQTPLYKVEAAEPGDNKWDGRFSFTVNATAATVKGRWIANNKKMTAPVKTYELSRKTFRYDPAMPLNEDLISEPLGNTYNEKTGESEALTNQVFKFNPSLQVLKSSDVENLYKGDLEVLRNLIYARHGYAFKNPKMRQVFEYVDWYMPVATDVTEQLTPIEKKNIELLKRYEAHAMKYYDSFGR